MPEHICSSVSEERSKFVRQVKTYRHGSAPLLKYAWVKGSEVERPKSDVISTWLNTSLPFPFDYRSHDSNPTQEPVLVSHTDSPPTQHFFKFWDCIHFWAFIGDGNHRHGIFDESPKKTVSCNLYHWLPSSEPLSGPAFVLQICFFESLLTWTILSRFQY